MHKSIALTPDIFHVGDSRSQDGLDCHPYLLIDGDEAVLFDPGSMLDIDIVLEKLYSLVPLSQIKYVVLHHQDPDFCTALPYLEEKGLNAQFVTSWRTMTLLQYYNVKSPYYLLEEHHDELILASGRKLEFIMTPYLHFAGSFMTYDSKTRTLFSSDLFGAFSFNKTFYADETYVEKMKTFHEHYMPCNAILRPVMETLLTYEIDRILPQHGSLIVENIPHYIHILRSLQCGSLMVPLKRNLLASGGFLTVFNDLYARYLATYNPTDVIKVFHKVKGFEFDAPTHIGKITEDGHDVWEGLFETIHETHGPLWLAVIEPYAKTLSATYDIPMPAIFHNLLESAHETAEQLMATNLTLERKMKSVEEKLVKDSVTGLYNEHFFKSLFIDELEDEDWRDLGTLMLINIDDFYKVKAAYGETEQRNTLSNMAYVLKNAFGESAVFRMQAAHFAVYVKDHKPEEAIKMADQIRNDIAESDLFISPQTISVGMVFPSELQLDAPTIEQTLDSILDLAVSRLRHAYELGKNIVCHTGNYMRVQNDVFRVLVVDPDHAHQDVLRLFLSELGMQVYAAYDGDEAKSMAEQLLPQLIISDVILPKIDGFLLRERLLAQSDTKASEFIYISHQKDDVSVTRAMELGVIHYLKKPYLLSELIGIADKKRKGLIG